MPDWRTYVKDHLSSLRLSRAETEDVTVELAEHLEEFYEALLAKGLSDEEAFSRTCVQAGNWKKLQRGVISAKEEGAMIDRVMQIWLPSLATLVSSWGVLALFIWTEVITHREPRGVVLFMPWLLLLPAIGAAGGYLCRRAGGTGWRVYLAGTFPALAGAIVFLVVLPFAFAWGIDAKAVPGFTFTAVAPAVANSVILPGLALYAGVVLQGLRKEKGATGR
jgi:hypothetical protein